MAIVPGSADVTNWMTWVSFLVTPLTIIVTVVLGYIKIYLDFNRRLDDIHKDLKSDLRPIRETLSILNRETGEVKVNLEHLTDSVRSLGGKVGALDTRVGDFDRKLEEEIKGLKNEIIKGA